MRRTFDFIRKHELQIYETDCYVRFTYGNVRRQTQLVKESIMQMLKKNKPPKGVVCALEVTEKQFSRMDYIVGELHSDVIDSDERLVIL